MSDNERDELDNAIAQARGTQAILQALLVGLHKRGQSALVDEAFNMAGDTFAAASLNTNKDFAAAATRALQVIEHMRSVVPK